MVAKAGDRIGHERQGPAAKREKCRNAVPRRTALFLRQILSRPGALMRPDAQVVPNPMDRPSAKRFATPTISTARGDNLPPVTPATTAKVVMIRRWRRR
jgi:hypothetical protein